MAKILIIDDNLATISMLETLLKISGYEIVTAFDGPSGIEKALSEMPALILLDIMMPQMDGIEVCTRLRQTPQTAAVPIVFLSAKADEKDIKRGLEAGANEYLLKPFNLEKLMQTVRKYAG